MSFHKIYFLLTYLVLASGASTGIKFPTDQESCKLRLSAIKNTTNTIILDSEDVDSKMKTCIIKDCYDDNQTVVIFTRGNPHINYSKDIIDALINKQSNYLFITNILDPDTLNNPIGHLLKKKWSYHHIIITTHNPKYNCFKDGSINEDIETFLNDLWHKFRIVYASLSLPYVCPGKLFKYDKKKASGRPLYNRTIKMVARESMITTMAVKEETKLLTAGYPLRANLFERFPTAIKNCDNLKYYMIPNTKYSRKYCGIDGIIMANLVEHFKLNLSLTGSRTFGYMQPDGTITGSLGNVLRGEVDISFSSRFMVPYVDCGISFLHAVGTDCLCIFGREPSDRPVWFFPVEAYKQKVWLLIIPMLMLLGFSSWGSNVLMAKYIGYRYLRTQSLLFHIWDAMLTGFLGFFIGKKPACYFLKGLCLIYSVIHVATFQGHANFVFATRIPFPKIETLEQVHEMGMKVYTTPGTKQLIEPPYNEIQEMVFRDNLYMRPTDENRGFKMVLQTENTAVVSRRADATLEILMSYSDTNREPLLSIVDDCFRCYSSAYIVTDGFLFEEAFQLFLQRITEAGLPAKYYAWTQLALRIPEPKVRGNRPRPTSKIELSDLRIGFALLLTGYVVSFAVYLCEIYWARKYRNAKWFI